MPPKKVSSKPQKEESSSSAPKQSGRTMSEYLQRTVSATLTDGRLIVGRFIAYDKHMNLVLHNTVEYPRGTQPAKTAEAKSKKDVGLVMVRGENVVDIAAVKKTKKAGVDPKEVNTAGGASAVPSSKALAKTSQPTLPKASGARRQREDDE